MQILGENVEVKEWTRDRSWEPTVASLKRVHPGQTRKFGGCGQVVVQVVVMCNDGG